MSTIAGLLQKVSKDNSWIDDSTDRLTRRYIVGIISVQLLVIYGGGFLRGNYIQCFTPKYFTGPQEKYSEHLCWLESTHYIIEPYDKNAVDDIGVLGFYNAPIYKTTGGKSGYVGINHPGQRITVSYYQWVPIYLLVVAFLSHIPFLMWKQVTLKCGLPLKSMMLAAREISSVDSKGGKTRSGYADDLAEVLLRYAESSRNERPSPFRVGKRHGNVVFALYVLTKLFYILIFILQLVLLQWFLGNDPRYNILSHGAWVLDRLVNNGTWPQHPAFPVDTTCVVMAEQQGNPLPYTLQCILPMNLYFDKFFALFTVAFPIVVGLFVVSLLRWLLANSASGRSRFLESHLVKPLGLEGGDFPGSDRYLINEFHKEFLQRDGLFALEMIKMNVGRFVTEHVLERLWLRYLELKDQRKIMRDAPSSTTSSSCDTPPKKSLEQASIKQRPSAPYESHIH